MKIFYIVFASVFILCGCASPPPTINAPLTYSQKISHSQNILTDQNIKLAGLRSQLLASKNAAEIKSLQLEITELEKRIDDLEIEIAENRVRQMQETTSNASSGRAVTPTTQIGPRGGCFRISKNGKKYYVKC